MASTPEKLVQTKIEAYLKHLHDTGHPVEFERRNASGLSYKEGRPDLWACYNGIHVEIECKQVDGEARTRQELWERRFRKAGSLYIRPRSVDEVIELFETLLIPTKEVY